MRIILVFGFLFIISGILGQNGIIEGRIYNASNNEPVPFANIVIWGTNIGATSDLEGNFIFTGVDPGFVELRASAIGFETYISENIMVTNANKVFIDIPMQETNVELEEIVVKASPFRRSVESPVSLQRIGIQEIEKNPGANRDISKVIQSLPGVASTPAFRNDLIVRGGGSSENRFYLDGIEIPNLNHFATQGASGGPTGIINVDFIREVNFYSGAFPANRGNALSSVLEFRQADGNKEEIKTRFTIGASDLALALDGPLGDKTTYVVSVRRSYLQLIFSAIGLPFLPTYNDFQFKTKTRFDEKNELTIVGLGALDQFELNKDANDTPYQRYILGYIPINEQWNYTIGAIYKHFRDNGTDNFVLSRNHLNNVLYKHIDNDESKPRSLDFSSHEIENKFRYEHSVTTDSETKILAGGGVQYAQYFNSTKRIDVFGTEASSLEYNTEIDMFHYGAFAQASQPFFNKRLTFSAGLRIDGSSYSKEMANPLNQFSPRISGSYFITPNFSVNASTGRFYQRPSYTIMGYSDMEGNLVNKENGLKYISVDNVVAGVEFLPGDNTRISLEGFFKYYRNYPYSVKDSVAISGKGADFGTYGDEELLPIAEGRAYGAELLWRSRNLAGFTTILAYTLVWSEFKENAPDGSVTDKYVPNAWDNRHLLNFTATRSFKGNWDVGFKWRFVGGSPYTPYDLYKSSLVEAWDAQGVPYLDYSRYNELRFDPFHQLDVRVDKQYFFNKWSLLLYIDVQNIYNFQSDAQNIYTRKSIIEGQPLDNDPEIDIETGEEVYKMDYIINDGGGTIFPTIGIIVEF